MQLQNPSLTPRYPEWRGKSNTTLRPAWATRRAESRDNMEPPVPGVPAAPGGCRVEMRYCKGPMPPTDKQDTVCCVNSVQVSASRAGGPVICGMSPVMTPESVFAKGVIWLVVEGVWKERSTWGAVGGGEA